MKKIFSFTSLIILLQLLTIIAAEAQTRTYYTNKAISGVTEDSQGANYMLLHKIYNGTNMQDTYVQGKITGVRGSTAAYNRKWTVEVNTSSARDQTRGSILTYNEGASLVTLTYNSEKYIAVTIANSYQLNNFSFTGYALNETLTIAYDDAVSDVQPFTGLDAITIQGNMGIGTTTPPNRLTIESTDTVIANYIRMEHKGIPNSLLFFGTAPGNYLVTAHRNANILESYTDLHLSAANSGRIFFETGRTGTAAPVRMTLTNTGLGIGTTTPTTSLNVEGGAIRHKNPAGYPYGINIDVDYPAGWAREYSFSYGAAGKMFAWGATGTGSTLNYGYIGGNSTADVVSATPWMVFKPNGNVGIGTTDPGSYKLAVAGTVAARRVKVTQDTWADFVFHPDYKLPALSEVEKYIKENQHLQEIPSAAEVEKEGLDLGEMNKKLLQKVEELTLYLLQQQKQIDEQNKRIKQLEARSAQ